jgi:hypothetical protein
MKENSNNGMKAKSSRYHLMDASALVCFFSNESNKGKLEEYFREYNLNSDCYTTPFCYYESLNILKKKCFHKETITKNEYLSSCKRLNAWYNRSNLTFINSGFKDLNFSDHKTIDLVESIVKTFDIDFSDAFQILSIKDGCFSSLVDGSKTILITQDSGLAIIARSLGLKVWLFNKESQPSSYSEDY